jgi:oxygen-independent coproporphyrinogen-3 oxidase
MNVRTSSSSPVSSKTPYLSYPYAYPHKTAYRKLDPPIPLARLWAKENRQALFFYIHVPFCKNRCGYCNLFSIARPTRDLQYTYLEALERQAGRVRSAIGSASFARMAIGGGTPTYLDEAGLDRLFRIAEHTFHIDLGATPISVEVSPSTVSLGKLHLLRESGVDRISIGVQSFVKKEVAAAGRDQPPSTVERALALIRRTGFPILNIDLIYGLPGQTVQSWVTSLKSALRFMPEELYLYPLYVRPLTRLKKERGGWKDLRLACYRAGRDFLRAAGYKQLSMRLFRADHTQPNDGPIYSCQEDGMVGLGCGARSYTRAYHYSSEYAVGCTSVQRILESYVVQPGTYFALAHHGFHLSPDEQYRRYAIKSLLRCAGLSRLAFYDFFEQDVLDCLPELAELIEQGLAAWEDGFLQLTETGLECSDTIGPWLYSPLVKRLIQEYELS